MQDTLSDEDMQVLMIGLRDLAGMFPPEAEISPARPFDAGTEIAAVRAKLASVLAGADSNTLTARRNEARHRTTVAPGGEALSLRVYAEEARFYDDVLAFRASSQAAPTFGGETPLIQAMALRNVIAVLLVAVPDAEIIAAGQRAWARCEVIGDHETDRQKIIEREGNRLEVEFLTDWSARTGLLARNGG